jgi:hypothetical protein
VTRVKEEIWGRRETERGHCQSQQEISPFIQHPLGSSCARHHVLWLRILRQRVAYFILTNLNGPFEQVCVLGFLGMFAIHGFVVCSCPFLAMAGVGDDQGDRQSSQRRHLSTPQMMVVLNSPQVALHQSMVVRRLVGIILTRFEISHHADQCTWCDRVNLGLSYDWPKP